jgi:hypothetical protein
MAHMECFTVWEIGAICIAGVEIETGYSHIKKGQAIPYQKGDCPVQHKRASHRHAAKPIGNRKHFSANRVIG